MSDESSLPPSPLAALIAPTTLAEFEERYWEREPLFLPRDELPSAFADLLRTDDVAELSERMAALEVEPQIMRNGERCQPRELLWDFLDGGSAIINRIDRLWPPIGRLCSALRADFLHVFAVMYLTPRDSRAVPAHTDDQDVFILQLAGRKAWTVYGSPIELPCTHEQLGKTEPIARSLWENELREPILTAELAPGSLLYLPRGFVHEARCTKAGGSSLHVTLTVQTSDLNWRTFLRDGLVELQRTNEAARCALPLDAALGGFDDDDDDDDGDGDEPAAVVAPAGDRPAPASHAPAAVAAPAVTNAPDSVSAAADGAGHVSALAQAAPYAAFDELMAWTAARADEGFELAMGRLHAKLQTLNVSQDRAIATSEAAGEEVRRAAAAAGRRPGLPARVAVVPGLQLRCTEEGAIECYDARRDRTLRTRLGGVSRAAVEALEELTRRGQPFAPAELPGCDDLERVAVVARLLGLGVLCDAEALHAIDDDGADGDADEHVGSGGRGAGGRAGGARGGGARSKRSGGRR